MSEQTSNAARETSVAYTKCADAWMPFGKENYGTRNRFQMKKKKTGVWLLEKETVFFRIYAPDASHVYVSCEGLTVMHGSRVNILDLEKSGDDFPEYRLELKKNEEGFWEGGLEPSEYKGFYGPFPFTFVVDGCSMVHPYCRTIWRSGRLMNCVEIPDREYEDAFKVKPVPHGSISYEIFWSSAREDWSPCLVYLPPDYHSSDQFYPVLYLQHGGGENETNWFTLGNVSEIMDNLIAEKKAVPFVIVMNNTRLPGRRSNESEGVRAFGAVEDLLVKDCIPYIEGKYRVRKDKWGRAIAGLSMGAMQSSYVGFGNPEIFGYIGLFSGSIRCRHYWEDYKENPHLSMLNSETEKIKEEYRLIYRGVAEQEFASRPWHKEDSQYLSELGVDQFACYHFTLHPTMCHEWGCFRRSLFEFVLLVFAEEKEKSV